MNEQELLKLQAERVVRTVSTEGFKDITDWINGRISILTAKISVGESDIKVEKVENKQGDSMKVIIVNIIKDEERHELRFWKMFNRKIEDWSELAVGVKK